MSEQKPAPVPPPSPLSFENGIAHPELWLWDSWTAEQAGSLHLYCLALSRRDADGQPIRPEERNDFPFHIRHFRSMDGGRTWRDEGAFMLPGSSVDGAYSRNIWSGCTLAREEKDWIAGFTGLRVSPHRHPFLQTICLGYSKDGFNLDDAPESALLCPERDYDAIRAAGYYLSAPSDLGSADGEEGGPILAWRDPFLVDAGNGKLTMVWSAKVSPERSAVAHATVTEGADGFHVETLHAPILLPDDHAFTQAEVPKLHHDSESGTWYLLISACDRLSERQPASEVTKVLRLYRASSLRGPWAGAFAGGSSLVPGTDFLFGASILKVDTASGTLKLIAPYTEYASDSEQLTFAPPVLINLRQESQSSGAGLCDAFPLDCRQAQAVARRISSVFVKRDTTFSPSSFASSISTSIRPPSEMF